MPFNFQKFSDPKSSYDAKVSIRQTGQFGFNAGAVNKYRLGDYAFVVLYFDADSKAIGIELHKEQCDGATELNSERSNVFIRAKNFCDRYGIEYSTGANRFPLRKDNETGFLYFLLREGERGEEDSATPTEQATKNEAGSQV